MSIMLAIGGGAVLPVAVKAIIDRVGARKPRSLPPAQVTVNNGPAVPTHYEPGNTGRFDLPPCGEHTVRLDGLEARAKQFESDARARTAMLVDHGEQLARIETKVDYLIPDPAHGGGGRRT